MRKIILILLAIIVIVVLYPVAIAETETVEKLTPITEFTAAKKAAILDLTPKNNPGDADRHLYSARHILDIAGVPFFETQQMSEALEASLILVSSPIKNGYITASELAALTTWVENGGVIISPVCTDRAFETLFGFANSPSYHKKRYFMNWVEDTSAELSYFNHEYEKSVSLGRNKDGNDVIKSYGYTLLEGDAEALAHFDTDEVAVIRKRTQNGRSYVFGLEWRDVIQRPQLNKDFVAQRVYSNGFDPSADVFPLFVRSVWNDIQDVAVWKYTVPNGYETMLVPTHDIDSRTAYDSMFYMSEYEKSLGLKAQYLLTTHYFRDELTSAYYDERSAKLAHATKADGHVIGSHSVGHFFDFNRDDLFPLGDPTITRENYNPEHIDGTTRNGSSYGEIKVSKNIIDAELGLNIRTFRSGHLCVNGSMTEALVNTGYDYSSCFSACDVLTSFPFFERIEHEWDGELTHVLQMPLHISDVFSSDNITVENYPEKVDIWFEVLNNLKDNYAPCIILIHPNRRFKMEAQRILIDMMDMSTCGLYNFEDYGDFWNVRHNFDFNFDYQEATQQLVIQASEEDILKAQNAVLGLMVEAKLPVENYRLVDFDLKEYPISVKEFKNGRKLVVILPTE